MKHQEGMQHLLMLCPTLALLASQVGGFTIHSSAEGGNCQVVDHSNKWCPKGSVLNEGLTAQFEQVTGGWNPTRPTSNGWGDFRCCENGAVHKCRALCQSIRECNVYQFSNDSGCFLYKNVYDTANCMAKPGFFAGHKRCSCGPSACNATTRLKDTVPAVCAGGACTQEECCAAKVQCSSQSAALCTGKYKVNGTAANAYCAGANCTAQECCQEKKVCSNTPAILCGIDFSDKMLRSDAKTTYCAGGACTTAECCVAKPTCFSSGICGGAASALKVKDTARATCQKAQCTQVECCDRKQTCLSSGVCKGTLRVKTFAAPYCKGGGCTEEECCEPRPTCYGSNVCGDPSHNNNETIWRLKDNAPEFCEGHICMVEECCKVKQSCIKSGICSKNNQIVKMTAGLFCPGEKCNAEECCDTFEYTGGTTKLEPRSVPPNLKIKSITFPRAFTGGVSGLIKPVVLLGLPTSRDPEPVMPYVESVTETGFKTSLIEPDCHDGHRHFGHKKDEKVDYLAFLPGIFATDGPNPQKFIVGDVEVKGQLNFQAYWNEVVFPEEMQTDNVVVIATLQNSLFMRWVSLRVQYTNRKGFKVLLSGAEGFHTQPCRLAYLAIPMGSGKIQGKKYNAIDDETLLEDRDFHFSPIRNPGFFGTMSMGTDSDVAQLRVKSYAENKVRLNVTETHHCNTADGVRNSPEKVALFIMEQ